MTARKRASTADYFTEFDAEPKGKARSKKQTEPSTRKKKITLYFTEGLLEEARSAVLMLGAEGLEPSNLSRLFGAALEHELERLRKRHHGGKPFPPYKSRLPGGGPRKK